METDPFKRFDTIFTSANDSGIALPDAFALATASADGQPSVRMVLLKSFDEHGFVFYTNLDSQKGSELSENPQAALCFWWRGLEQVRVRGRVETVSDEEADAYFATRPRGSQLGAWASKQSAAISSREELLKAYREVERNYGDREVPRPTNWTGFRLIPHAIEFWTNKDDRLHKRDLYTRTADDWAISILSP